MNFKYELEYINATGTTITQKLPNANTAPEALEMAAKYIPKDNSATNATVYNIEGEERELVDTL